MAESDNPARVLHPFGCLLRVCDLHLLAHCHEVFRDPNRWRSVVAINSIENTGTFSLLRFIHNV